MSGLTSQQAVSRRRLTIYYAILLVVLAAVVVVVFSAGADEHAQPNIAGFYTPRGLVNTACLTEKFQVQQSGQFVSLDNGPSTVSGKLKWKDGRLTGTVDCAKGPSQPIVATAASSDAIKGTLGGRPLVADFVDSPPPAGQPKPRVPGSIKGEYALTPRSSCLGGKFDLAQDGSQVTLSWKDKDYGVLAYDTDKGTLIGKVRCINPAAPGGRVVPRPMTGTAAGRTIDVVLPVAQGGAAPAEHSTATKQREFSKTVAAFFLAVIVVMLFARFMGSLMPRIRQPRVMGEVLAGIILGPTVLGALFPGVEDAIFPSDVIPYIGVAANLGLIFYMFLVGLELDSSQLKGRFGTTAAISNTGVAIPMMLGLAVALPVYKLVGPESDGGFKAFALFMGVSMSITAFPVLARIVAERRMLKRPLGALALASAAIDDVTAWFLIALATAFATQGGGGEVIKTIALAIAFTAVMFLVVRRLLARAAIAFDEAGRVPALWITAIFAGILLSAYITEQIGIALIFGAFIMGAVMPRHAGLTNDVTTRIEDFVVTVLLPLFFAYTGLKTNVLLLDRGDLVLITLVLIVVAIVCKFGGTLLAARVMRLPWKPAAMLGLLMNTRGLTELIVLNLALEKGVISQALFAALVLMALVTTFMAGPLLNLLDPKNEYGAPVEEELEKARRDSEADSPIPIPDKSILVAPQSDATVDQLIALAEPLAHSEPPRELILARVMPPPGVAAIGGGLQAENRQLESAGNQLALARMRLLEHRTAARAVTFTSPKPGDDLAKLADSEEVDLTLIDGSRPLLGGGVPKGDVGLVLRKAPSDVAVLVTTSTDPIQLGPDHPVVVPFGGADHDWAALELGAWMASVNNAPLKLLGAGGRTDEGQPPDRDPTRLLGTASLLVQQFAGIVAEPVVAEGGGAGIVEAATGAGLLLIGLSERWREEGLGETRAGIAEAAPAPILFVRRGVRPGALAPKDNVTRFTWSSPAIGIAGRGEG